MRLLSTILCSVVSLTLAHGASITNSYTGTLDVVSNPRPGVTQATPVWFLAFTVSAGTRMVFDVLAAEKDAFSNGPVQRDWNNDGRLTYLDTQVEVYNANWSLLALNDDHGGYRSAADGNGSIYRYDSYLTYTFAQAGTYWAALTTWQPSGVSGAQSGIQDIQSWNTNGANWRIDVTTLSGSASTPVLSAYKPAPEPATLGLIGLAVGGAAWMRRRREKAQA
jgi:hypothetical protein